jgi:branched-chain amino acid transport system permease protein
MEELALFQTDFGRLWAIAGFLIIFGLIPLAGSPYFLKTLSLIGIYSIAAIGLNVLTGCTGIISLGHSAIFGLGAYTAVILTSSMNLPIYVSIPAGGIISAVAGVGFGLPAVRLTGIYICFATLACQKIMEFIFINWQGATGGAYGISIPGTGTGIGLKDNLLLYYAIFAILTLTALMAVNLMRSKFGRALCAIRDDQRAAEAIGIPAARYKLLSFAFSSFYAGLAGALFSFFSIKISPGDFNVSFSVILIAMIIIGGMGSISGSVIGACIIVLLKEALVFSDGILQHTFSVSFRPSSLYEFAAGLLLALFIIYKPKGIMGAWKDIRLIFSSWPLSQVSNNGAK